MPTPAEMAERHSRILGELSELGLGLARDLQARALAAEDPEAAAALGLAFHRISRSLRQTLALEAKLERDRSRAEREAREAAAAETRDRIAERKARVRATVEREVWTEYEVDSAEYAVAALDDLLNEEAFAETFLDEPAADLIARLRHDLALDVAYDAEGVPLGEGEETRPRRAFFNSPRKGERPLNRRDLPALDYFGRPRRWDTG